jgi:hypothetical protein
MGSPYNQTHHKNDEFMSTPSTLLPGIPLIPEGERVWEPFFGNGNSTRYLTEQKISVFSEEDKDFFSYTGAPCNVVFTNPPFSIKWEILTKLSGFENLHTVILLLPLRSLSTEKLKNYLLTSPFRLEDVVLLPRATFFDPSAEKEVQYGFGFVWMCLKRAEQNLPISARLQVYRVNAPSPHRRRQRKRHMFKGDIYAPLVSFIQSKGIKLNLAGNEFTKGLSCLHDDESTWRVSVVVYTSNSGPIPESSGHYVALLSDTKIQDFVKDREQVTLIPCFSKGIRIRENADEDWRVPAFSLVWVTNIFFV